VKHDRHNAKRVSYLGLQAICEAECRAQTSSTVLHFYESRVIKRLVRLMTERLRAISSHDVVFGRAKPGAGYFGSFRNGSGATPSTSAVS